jgi:hypothetical protein
MKRVIIYSHGFGSKKDDRGMFTAIAIALPEFEHVMFNYSDVDEVSKTLTIHSLNEQTAKLTKVLHNVKKENPKTKVSIVAHSQGCLISAMVNPTEIEKTIFITPPTEMNENKLIDYFVTRKSSELNKNGYTKIPRKDGSTTMISYKYWQSLKNIDPQKLYENYINNHKNVLVINANQDEVLSIVSPKHIKHPVKMIDLDGNHSFSFIANRNKLINSVKEYLES